jgi:hypothetical protein
MVPFWAIKLGVVALAVAVAWGHGYHHGAGKEQRKTAAAVQAAKDDARAEESRRVMRLQEAQDAEHLARTAAQRDAAAARSAADGLRRAAAGFVCLPSDPASSAGSAPAGAGPGVLPDVLGELAARADRLAEQADSARIAGQLCERAYDALRPTP